MPRKGKRRGGGRRRRRSGAGRPELKDVLVTSAALGFMRGKATDASLSAEEREKALFNKVPNVANIGRTGVIGIGAYFFRKKNKWVNALAYSALCSAVERLGEGGLDSLRGDGDGDSVEGEIEP